MRPMLHRVCTALCTLYPADCRSLQVISFYFEYLAREKYKSRRFCFVPGATTFLLTNGGGQPRKEWYACPRSGADLMMLKCFCCAQAWRMPQGWQSHWRYSRRCSTVQVPVPSAW